MHSVGKGVSAKRACFILLVGCCIRVSDPNQSINQSINFLTLTSLSLFGLNVSSYSVCCPRCLLCIITVLLTRHYVYLSTCIHVNSHRPSFGYRLAAVCWLHRSKTNRTDWLTRVLPTSSPSLTQTSLLEGRATMHNASYFHTSSVVHDVNGTWTFLLATCSTTYLILTYLSHYSPSVGTSLRNTQTLFTTLSYYRTSTLLYLAQTRRDSKERKKERKALKMTENMRNALKGVGGMSFLFFLSFSSSITRTLSRFPHSPSNLSSVFRLTADSYLKKQAASKKPRALWATSWATAWTCAADSRRNPTRLGKGFRIWGRVSFFFISMPYLPTIVCRLLMTVLM